jgi:serine-type D-Ala-D-Ala carboxypeptidase (penicillin-binding protein 5/6)
MLSPLRLRILTSLIASLASLWLLPTIAIADALIPPPPAIAARGYIVMDPNSGVVIAAVNDTQRLDPASLTKLMTAYVVFDALRAKKLKLDQTVAISPAAWKQEGSRTFLEPGMQVRIEDLIKGMVIQSGNDAAVALAEAVAGNEQSFAQLMNLHTQRLGMRASRWENATGLPSAEHYTTARDLATLASAVIREFPQHYRYYSLREFTFNGITQPNRNGLLGRDASVDGIKTGHTDTAGYCLASSAQRQGMRLVAVVLGADSPRTREDASQALLNWGFSFFESRRLYGAGKAVRTAEVFKSGEQVGFGVRRDLWVTVPRGDFARVKITVALQPRLVAPLAVTQVVGRITATLDGQPVGKATLHAMRPVSAGHFLRRGWDSVRLLWN